MSLEAARQALIERQGAGARYDAPQAPAADLLLARRHTAQVARLLNDVTDAALFADTGPGMSLARHIAMISLEARRMSELIAAVRAGAPLPAFLPERAEVDRATSLPGRALRHLFDHTRVHLNVEWRELSDADWARNVTTPDKGAVSIAALPRMRAAALQTTSQAFLARV